MLTRTQGYFTGTYNAIAGKVTHNGKHVGDISGKWNESMEYKNSKVSRHGCVGPGDADVLWLPDG